MLTKIEVENKWRSWVNEKAEQHRLCKTDKFTLQDTIAKEVQWYLDNPVTQNTIEERIKKYAYMKDNSLARIQDFDRFWDLRLDFFRFILQDDQLNNH